MNDGASVYHAGEVAVQERAGEREIAVRRGGLITPIVLPKARPFLADQRMLVLAAGDSGGEVWVSVWFGRPGFAESDDEGRVLRIDRSQAATPGVDPVTERLRPGAAVGVLAIELETRRRLRVNGAVRAFDGGRLVVGVRESFPNCPKYIASRRLRPRRTGSAPDRAATVAAGTALDGPRIATIRRSDTVFVGSLHPERGADASHRGGDPGFINIVDDRLLRIPDYSGNGMFQTLGNLHATGRAGLVFLDFEGRRLLHVTGETALRFDQDEASLVTGGTGRSWDLRVSRWLEGALPADVDAELLDRSPFNPGTEPCPRR